MNDTGSLSLLNENIQENTQDGGSLFSKPIEQLKKNSKKLGEIPPKPENINEQKFKDMIEIYYGGEEVDIFMEDFKNTINLFDTIKQFKNNLETGSLNTAMSGGDPKTIYEGKDISMVEKTALKEWENQFKEKQEKISTEIKTTKSDCQEKQQKADEKAANQEKEERDRQHQLDLVRETTKINAESYKETMKEIQEIIEKAKQEILAKKAECQAVESSKEVD